MTGRVIIVTGASSGLGYETARYLCEGGNDVILACRDDEKAKRAIDKIKQQNPNALATYMQLDLSSLDSIRKFVGEFHATGKKLHVIVNNAGLALNFKDVKRQYTADGFELTIGTNHLGPFLLTNLLLDDLKKAGESGDARVVVVTSALHDPRCCKRTRNLQPLDTENLLLFNEGSYNGLQAYKNSKAANIMFTYELARKLSGSGVKVNAVCPGNIPCTDLLRNAGNAEKLFSRCVLHGVLRFTKMTRTIPQGAQFICSVATDDKYKDVTGKYIKEGQEASSSEETQSEEVQTKLWELSGRYTSLDGYEPLAPPPRPVEEEDKQEEKKAGEDTKAAETGEEKKGDEEEKKEEKDADKSAEEKPKIEDCDKSAEETTKTVD